MPIGTCPNCGKGIDIDGYVEFIEPTLFYCECGKIYEMKKFMIFTEIPSEEIDLSGIIGWPIPEDYYRSSFMSRGLFIQKSHCKKTK